MTRRVRVWISAVVIMASAALAAGLTAAAHASEERSRGTGHSGQPAVNQTYTYVYLAGSINQVGGGPVLTGWPTDRRARPEGSPDLGR